MFGVGLKSCEGCRIESLAVAVGHPRRCEFTACGRLVPVIPGVIVPALPPSEAEAVGHEPQALTDVRGTDARSWDTDRRAGVTDSFQVVLYKVEPAMLNRCFNLLTKDDWRLALADEVVECGPKMPLVSKPELSACRAERLARSAACPDRTLIRPVREP